MKTLVRSLSLFAFALILAAPGTRAVAADVSSDEAIVDLPSGEVSMDQLDEAGAELDSADAFVRPYPYPHGRSVVCQARNRRGVLFSARGPAYASGRIQERAMRQCYSYGSRHCYALGCFATY